MAQRRITYSLRFENGAWHGPAKAVSQVGASLDGGYLIGENKLAGRLIGTTEQIASAMQAMAAFDVEAVSGVEDEAPLSALDLAKLAQRETIIAAHDADVEDGVTPDGSQITLGASTADQNAFSRQAVMLREAQELGTIDGNTQQSISDIDGIVHTMTVTQLRTLLVGYGMAIKTLWDTKAQKLAAIDAAETIEAVQAVTWE